MWPMNWDTAYTCTQSKAETGETNEGRQTQVETIRREDENMKQ